ncbi:MAG: 2-hydroxyglutaryl-CoA dehydratase [Clostridiales bacterium]|jgi:predicted nucleotide-binding protein (sugar kinase/HSP70/actin superfamily)|nr:2-hydroxyglutaryl-CoA dehydratase [Clostridiales bacterium]
MRVGIPKGLLYYKYHPFFNKFFTELGAEIITSSHTNKGILDEGVKYCVDEACLPVKVFHGHVASIRDKCDLLVIPRIMRLRKSEFICPKFCGLPEMVKNSMGSLPEVIGEPIYATSEKELYVWARSAGERVVRDRNKIITAFKKAMEEQKSFKSGINDVDYNIKVAITGHPYNIYDNFVNMDVVKKLHKLGVGAVTEEYVDEKNIDEQIKELFKRPFWTFARNSYGFTTYLSQDNSIDGIVYISSFACGIDSIVIELIKDRIGNFPLLILKIDEHTGEAGLDTRIEAFVDMLERR